MNLSKIPFSIASHCRFLSTTSPSQKLTWEQYFALRKRVQLLQRTSGIPFALGFLTAESAVLSLPIFDPTKLIMGMDPLVVVGLSTICGTVLSYISGMSLSGALWRRLRPSLAAQLNEKQKDFYHRITLHRANVPPNPSQMNLSFDYYGEKIKCVADYRNWLKRQRKLKNERIFK